MYIYIYIHSELLGLVCDRVWVLVIYLNSVCLCLPSAVAKALACSNECLIVRTLNELVSFVF